MTTRELKWDIGWLGTPPTDSPDRALGRQDFFVYCMWCDKWNKSHTLKCKTKRALVDLYHAYRKRIDLSSMGFSMKDSDLEAIADRTWDDEDFQEAIKN